MARISMNGVLKFLGTEEMGMLLLASDRGILSFSDLDAYEMPMGCTKEEAWVALNTIRKHQATPLPASVYSSDSCWYTMSSYMVRAVKDLEIKTAVDHPLDKTLQNYGRSPFVSSNLEKTAFHALKGEGIDISEQRLHEIFAGNATNLEGTEKVLENFFGLLSEAPRLAERSITPGFIEMLHYRLLEGVKPGHEELRAKESPWNEFVMREPLADPVALACHCAEDPDALNSFFSPILTIIYITFLFFDFQAVPSYSALVGIVLRNTLAYKWGHPVIAWLPYVYLPLDKSQKSRAETVFIDSRKDFGLGFDLTNDILVFLDIYQKEVERLEGIAEQIKKLTALVEQTLSCPMNERQEVILSTVCRDPFAQLSIEAHRRAFDVVYSTARKDFVDLERKGYLVKCKQEHTKTLLYSAHPDLRERLMRLGEAFTKDVG